MYWGRAECEPPYKENEDIKPDELTAHLAVENIAVDAVAALVPDGNEPCN